MARVPPMRAAGVPATPRAGDQIRRVALALAFGTMAGVPADDAASLHYRLKQATWDGGGGTAASAHYRVVTSLGTPGGTVGSAGQSISLRQGFAGVLNEPPLATPDTLSRPAGLPVKVRVESLLANDQDPDADRLRLRGFEALSNAGGRLALDNGWLLYEPPAGPSGPDSFRYTIEDEAGEGASGWVTVLVAGAGLQPSRNLIAITTLPNGHRHLAFAGIAGRAYAIEWSDALPAASWEVLAVLTADAHGLIEWVDASEPAPAQRYYRTVDR